MSLPPLPDVPRERRQTATVVAIGAFGVLCLLALVFGVRGLFAPAEGEPPSAGGRDVSTAVPSPAQEGGASSSPSSAATATGTASTDAVEFVSPSGNIRCRLSSQEARCDITTHDWDPPAPPASCTQTYGNGLFVTAKGSGLVCAEDTVVGGDALEYGDSVQRGNLQCASDEDGMTCTDLASKHAFTLARASYSLK